MMNIKLLTLFTIALGLNMAIAQEIKIKKEDILLDGETYLKYERLSYITHSIYDMEENEILFVQLKDNGTRDYRDDDYYILNFLANDVKVESSDFSRISAGSVKKLMEKLVTWLIKDKVLRKDGTINADRLEVFFTKYDENITERTIRN